MAKRTSTKSNAKKPAPKKQQRRKPKAEQAATATAVADDEDEDADVEDTSADDALDDGIDEDDLTDDTEDDDTEDDDAEDDDAEDDDAEDDDAEDDDAEGDTEDDDTEDDDAEGDTEDDDTEGDADAEDADADAEGEVSDYSAGFDTIDYHADDLKWSKKRDADSPRVKEMAKSIRANGLMNPVTVGTDGVIIAGNTRAAALKAMGKPIPCRIAVDPKTGEQISSKQADAAFQALAENVNRATITPLEQGREFNAMIKAKQADDSGEIAKRLGIGKSVVEKYMTLAKDASKELTAALEGDRVTTEAALTILRRSKNSGEADALLAELLEASRGKKVGRETATKAAQSKGKGKKSNRGRKPTNRAISDEALATDQTGISGKLKLDRESGVYTVELFITFDWNQDTFAGFNIEKSVQSRLSRLDLKAVRAEMEIARKALTDGTS